MVVFVPNLDLQHSGPVELVRNNVPEKVLREIKERLGTVLHDHTFSLAEKLTSAVKHQDLDVRIERGALFVSGRLGEVATR